tara:strand:+ start:59955 stop:60113 length:159 start_codon:yes stop_codon:yes gene_type:complete
MTNTEETLSIIKTAIKELNEDKGLLITSITTNYATTLDGKRFVIDVDMEIKS